VKRALKVIVALFLLWLVVRNLNLEALVAALQRLRFWPVTAAIAIFFLSCCVATSKWRLLWPKAPWLEMLKANFIGQFYSTALPGQIAGEVVKTYRLGQRFSDTAAVAASVLVDRATGIVGLLLLAFVGVLLSKARVPSAAVALLVGSAAAVMAALCAISVPRLADTAKRVIEKSGDRWRLLRGVSRALTALLLAWKSLMSRPRIIVASICLGVAFQALGILAHLVVASRSASKSASSSGPGFWFGFAASVAAHHHRRNRRSRRCLRRAARHGRRVDRESSRPFARHVRNFAAGCRRRRIARARAFGAAAVAPAPVTEAMRKAGTITAALCRRGFSILRLLPHRFALRSPTDQPS
jgi:uncharacterized membrane protein YbhN (UPF0104 family)